MIIPGQRWVCWEDLSMWVVHHVSAGGWVEMRRGDLTRGCQSRVLTKSYWPVSTPITCCPTCGSDFKSPIEEDS